MVRLSGGTCGSTWPHPFHIDWGTGTLRIPRAMAMSMGTATITISYTRAFQTSDTVQVRRRPLVKRHGRAQAFQAAAVDRTRRGPLSRARAPVRARALAQPDAAVATRVVLATGVPWTRGRMGASACVLALSKVLRR